MNTIVSAIMSIIMALMSVIGGLFGFNSYKEYDAKMTREEVVALYNTSLTTAGTTGCTLNFYRTTTFDLNNIAVAGTLNETAKKYFDINQNIDLAKGNFNFADKFDITADEVEEYRAWTNNKDDNFYISFVLNTDIIGIDVNPATVEKLLNGTEISGFSVSADYDKDSSSMTIKAVLDSDKKLTSLDIAEKTDYSVVAKYNQTDISGSMLISEGYTYKF